MDLPSFCHRNLDRSSKIARIRNLCVLQDDSRLASVVGFRVSIDESLQGQIRNGELFLPHGRHGFLK